MPGTSIYDFINGGTIELAFPHPPAGETGQAQDGRHGLRPLLTPDPDAFALLRAHAEMLAGRPKAH